MIAEKIIPARPREVIKEHTEDIVEWDCEPILAPESDMERDRR